MIERGNIGGVNAIGFSKMTLVASYLPSHINLNQPEWGRKKPAAHDCPDIPSKKMRLA
jgi:hypothetical protein